VDPSNRRPGRAGGVQWAEPAADHSPGGPSMASANVLELTTENFQTQVTGGSLVVADFWAPWCGPCRQLSPIIDRIADQFAGKVKVGKLNVDENPNIAVRYDVMTIPRVLFFRGSDTPVHQEIGVLPEAELVRLINQHQA